MNCRVCGGITKQVFSLGKMPLANSLLDSPDQSYKTYSLNLMLCADCSLVQLRETVPPEEMFTDYNYLTSCSPPMVEHAAKLVDEVFNRCHFVDPFVVEIGSNDGYLLQHYVKRHLGTLLGIDPSHKAADAASEVGVPTLTKFFNLELAKTVGPQADIIHANNVLAHVPDLNDFVAGLALLLKPDGVLIVEVPYVCDLIDKTAFDTIYHEHVYYFSLTSLSRLFSQHGLQVDRFERIPTHGGSLRLWVTHGGRRLPAVDRFDGKYFEDFSRRVEKCKLDTRDLLRDLHAVGFGAAAKATVFLNACGITNADLVYVVDDTPTKQGKYIPGTGLRILSSESWLKDQPAYTLITAWNFAHEIAHRYRIEYKGKFFTWYTPHFAEASA